MKGEARRDNRVVATLDACDEARLESHAVVAREAYASALDVRQRMAALIAQLHQIGRREQRS